VILGTPLLLVTSLLVDIESLVPPISAAGPESIVIGIETGSVYPRCVLKSAEFSASETCRATSPLFVLESPGRREELSKGVSGLFPGMLA